jgi:DNA-binding transcriptional MerR regulator
MNPEKPGIKKLYYSIGEVSEITGLKPYVLRYWETEFKQLNPPKNRAGNRTYRQKDIDIILRIKDLLYNKKFTIEGARQQIRQELQEPSLETVASDPVIDVSQNDEMEKLRSVMVQIKQELQTILDIIHE